jgi:hypothetical protein
MAFGFYFFFNPDIIAKIPFLFNALSPYFLKAGLTKSGKMMAWLFLRECAKLGFGFSKR